MNEAMWERLRIDPGKRTLGELLQEREWALQEIGRLRLEVMRFTQSAEGRKQAQELKDEIPQTKALPIAGRLIRLKEIKHLTGLSTSTIYKYVNENRFPKAVRLGERSVAWRGEDIQAWQQSRAEWHTMVGPDRLKS
jgi:prophage regulatory protein